MTQTKLYKKVKNLSQKLEVIISLFIISFIGIVLNNLFTMKQIRALYIYIYIYINCIRLLLSIFKLCEALEIIVFINLAATIKKTNLMIFDLVSDNITRER